MTIKLSSHVLSFNKKHKLVEWAVARQGADSVDVNEQNPQAVGFYLRMGFAVPHRHRSGWEW